MDIISEPGTALKPRSATEAEGFYVAATAVPGSLLCVLASGLGRRVELTRPADSIGNTCGTEMAGQDRRVRRLQRSRCRLPVRQVSRAFDLLDSEHTAATKPP
jgi:hypothetical protein